MLSRQGVERINGLKSPLRIPTVLEFAGFSTYPKQISAAACCSLQGSMTKKILRIKLLLTMLIRPNIVENH